MQKKRNQILVVLLFLLSSLLLSALVFSEPVDFPEIQKLVQSFKKDSRGPYQAIRWFYPDGRTITERPSTSGSGAVQHALHKDIVLRLQRENGIYLGQILTGIKHEDFLDASRQYSRMKQYQMEQYLRAVDDGWIFQRAQYYRGALQVEDEEKWGVGFLTWLLSRNEMLVSDFFLCRQITQDIPHRAQDNRITRIRVLSKNIASAYSPFMDIRVKIHGQPDAHDLARVRDFRKSHQGKVSTEIDKQLEELEQKLGAVYQEPGIQTLSPYIQKLPADSRIIIQLKSLIQDQSERDIYKECRIIGDLLWNIREDLSSIKSGKTRLALMDLSIDLEAALVHKIGECKPETMEGLLERNYFLAKAAAGCGFIEVWEWASAEPFLKPPEGESLMSLEEFIARLDNSHRAVYWGTGMVRATYEPTMNLFSRFEPLASGLGEEKIRTSVLLSFGDTVTELSEMAAQLSGLSNRVLGIRNQNDIRGLNPGFALGELEVVMGSADEIAFSASKIYMLQRAPADLKPVAGIASVAEGNLVSHVQLLARNLGIPNAILSQSNLRDMLPFSGQTVFYAVSPRGAVLMKSASEMTSEEKDLVEAKKRKEERIRVPTNKLDLKRLELVSLMDLQSADSGRICGPKAANLGQLRSLFPDRVAPGFVITFGVFRNAMDQAMPGTGGSFWNFLEETFAQAARERQSGKDEEKIEGVILQRLSQLQEAIKEMPLPPDLTEKLRNHFREVLGGEIGQVPVFIRSDTNMEDLKDFTGAGLNLTVPNVVKEKDIMQAIRDVWASPFRERGYRWRQKYLLNPENVYPSILILKSVNVEKSGVMITTGIASSDARDITVSFNWGIGGAVDGQATESYLLRHDGWDVMLSPAREAQYRYLPLHGGVEKGTVGFGKPILSQQERNQLRELDREIRKRLPGTPGIESEGPFDVELGLLNGAIWLFQVRPFVENKNARSTRYLNAMDPKLPKSIRISLTEKL